MSTEADGTTFSDDRAPRTDVNKALMGGATYRSLSEQKLSPQEERFEKARRTSGYVLAPLAAVAVWCVPLDIEAHQQSLAAVLAAVIVLWFCETVPIPVGGLIGVSAIVLVGVAPASDVLAPFGSPTIFTFVGAFILAQAMLKHGVAQRLAYFVLALPGVGKSTVRIIVAFGVITALLSALISNTATVAMLLPTALGILAVIARMMQEKGLVKPDFDPTRLRVGTALMLMLAYGAGVGGLLTPVGAPPNLIGRGLIEEATGERITFAQWIGAAAPVSLVLFGVLLLVLLLVNKPEVRRIEGVEGYIAERRAEQGSISRAEWNTIIAFALTVTLWLLPSVAGVVVGMDSSTYEFLDDRLNEGVVAVVGASLLFILPTNWSKRQSTLNWSDASKIDWGTIILFGTGMIFGSLLSSTGLAETIGENLFGTLGVGTPFAITLLAAFLALMISETTSNTASAAVVVPIVLPLAAAAGVDPMIPAMAATLGASFGFMLPVATPQNAIVYGSGIVPITQMIKTGIGLNVVGGLILVLMLPVTAGLVGIGA
ncbi:SLC13 family permease [Nesterenkonia cremea]|uniref:Sodium-dependent dicarboxylate transporter SdcS n=1 Tax=Nesterenkonia cremea TaxID=1882340 RepID=A0A917AWX5_9MICC|nr:DASS family sodium-coupled anion symporter [Nesterenkonia cremea]GGE78827.1 di- and tricarboxylate transporter [Nesterenkonia cremea]